MNLCKGDIIEVTEPVWNGRNTRPVGERTYTARIAKDTYGASFKHWFTLDILKCDPDQEFPLPIGKRIRRQGKNLYSNAVIIEDGAEKSRAAEAKSARKEYEGYWM